MLEYKVQQNLRTKEEIKGRNHNVRVTHSVSGEIKKKTKKDAHDDEEGNKWK